MKDEEMAKQFAKEYVYGLFPSFNESRDSQFIKCSEAGFLAGLKTDRPQWHKIFESEPPCIERLKKENAVLKEKSSRQSKNYKCDVGKLLEENAEWKQRNETLKDALEHARKVYGDDLEKSYKEIAELKEQNRSYEQLLETGSVKHMKECVRLKEYLKKEKRNNDRRISTVDCKSN